jgi:hypothetical protein
MQDVPIFGLLQPSILIEQKMLFSVIYSTDGNSPLSQKCNTVLCTTSLLKSSRFAPFFGMLILFLGDKGVLRGFEGIHLADSCILTKLK